MSVIAIGALLLAIMLVLLALGVWIGMALAIVGGIGMEMLLTGDPIDAETAARWGLINKVVPHKDLMKSAREYAARVAANAPLAVQAAKELAIRSRDTDINTGLRIEQLIGRMLRETEDAKEGPKAFREKRKPNFKGN